MTRPKWCPCDNDMPDPCPACGATISGNDSVRGVCQATTGRSKPKPYLPELILVYRDTGERV